jgi:hypothetical protein
LFWNYQDTSGKTCLHKFQFTESPREKNSRLLWNTIRPPMTASDFSGPSFNGHREFPFTESSARKALLFQRLFAPFSDAVFGMSGQECVMSWLLFWIRIPFIFYSLFLYFIYFDYSGFYYFDYLGFKELLKILLKSQY